MPDFLFEIGLEEIPARMIAPAQAELARRVEDLLTRERLWTAQNASRVPHPSRDVREGWDTAQVCSYSTPRRLAVLVKSVQAAQADTEEQLTGPSWNIAFKNGEPTPAAHAFAKKAGVEISALQKITTPKGEYVSATAHRKGRTAPEILADQLPKEIAGIYWPKNMYWRAGKPERFVRPVKWLVALLDHAIVPVEFAGVHAANITRGHRVLHEAESVTIEHAGDYLGHLEAAHVTADVELRRHRIRKALDAAVRSIPGARWREDHALVDTVTHLTEWPTILLGSFDPEYLTLPEEVLVTVMRDHQKYFAVEDANHKLAPYFLTVLNTQPEEHGDEIIRHGNQRVLRARFNDARFFWDVDQKIPLTERVEMLHAVTFHRKLGSYHEKIARLKAIADDLIHFPSYSNQTVPIVHDVNEAALKRACDLCKADLTTELVKEFTELQGVIGGLYAAQQGQDLTVAWAIYDQYKPQSTDDQVPRSVEGCLLALSDKLDTLGGMFGIGEKPSGSRDPFGLRRQANGVIKIIANSATLSGLRLARLARVAVSHLGDQVGYWEGSEHKTQTIDKSSTSNELSAFFRERLEFYLRDILGFAYDVVNAVMAAGYDDVRDAIARAEALTAVRGSEDFAAIAAAFKRIKNILRQAAENGQFISRVGISGSLMIDPAERSLNTHAGQIGSDVEHLSRTHKYREALELIATLRPDVDLFFDKVMVMVEDEAIRSNRLELLTRIQTSFSSIADFSEIVTS